MTNKEAIERLQKCKRNLELGKSLGILISEEGADERIEAYDLAIKALEEVKGLRLLVDWAVDCDFGYDNIPEEYEKYKDEIADMRYTEGLIHIAKREAEDD